MSHSKEQLMQWLAARHMWTDLLEGQGNASVVNECGNVGLSGDIVEILDSYVLLQHAGVDNLCALSISCDTEEASEPLTLKFDFPFVVFDECKACFFLSERQVCPDCNGDGGEYRIAKH